MKRSYRALYVSLAVAVLFGATLGGLQAQSDHSSPIAETSEAGASVDGKEESGEANETIVDTGAGTPGERSYPILDPLWALPILYENKDNPWLQKLSLFGRYHGQFYSVDSAQGSASDWETRRFRAGARMKLFEDFTLAGSFNLDTDEDASGLSLGAESLDVATIAWRPQENFQIVIGQEKPGFSYEYATSSNRILTIERSLLVNQIVPDKLPGIQIATKHEGFEVRVGGFIGAPIGESGGEPVALLKLGYDLSEYTRFEKTGLGFDYLYNADAKNEGAAPYQNLFALSADFQQNEDSGMIQLLYGDGYEGVSDSYGLVIMPARFIYLDIVQVVARYQYAGSTGDNGLRLIKRYEREVPLINLGDQLGDRYHAGYLGVNCYLYGNKLKVMAGVEYSHMEGGPGGGDFDGWTWMTGVRMHF